MTKSILVSLAILTLATSTASAAQRTTPNRQPMNAFASMRTSPPVIRPAGVSNSDRTLYYRNLHDSGYSTKNNFNAFGNHQVAD